MEGKRDCVGMWTVLLVALACYFLGVWFTNEGDRKLAEALAHERARIDLLQLEVFGDEAAPRMPSVWLPDGGPTK